MAINYVRFQRGTLSAYKYLLERNKIDDNTLYFIYSDDNESMGSLYMGTRLISSGETNYIQSSLNELSDVNVSDAKSHSFLVKDDITNNWISKTPEQVAQLIQDYIQIEAQPIPTGDNLSVEVINNVIQLKNYGINYYAFVPSIKDENGNIIEPSKYVLTEGFKQGLEPRVEEKDGVLSLSWYEPNFEDLNNLNDEIHNLKISITALEESTNNLEQDVLELVDSIVETNSIVDYLNEKIGIKSTDENIVSTGIYKDLENLESLLNSKVDISNTYSKTEIDKLIATSVSNVDHLRRKIVNNIDEINLYANDAELYIYMVPTGLQYEDDKYDEYIIIDHVLEKVGSWEINLDNYASKDDLKSKVDKIDNARLITFEEAEKLNSVEFGAQVNFINSVNEKDFTVNNNQLHLNILSIDKIENLENILNNKVDSIDGYSLLSPDDKLKLDKLIIGEQGNLEISTKVNADNIVGLEEWLNDHSSTTVGLSENNLTDELYNKLSNLLLITGVNETEFSIDDGELNLVQINQSKITGLEDALNEKASKESVNNINNLIKEITDSLNTKVSIEKYDEDLNEIRDILTWKEM